MIRITLKPLDTPIITSNTLVEVPNKLSSPLSGKSNSKEAVEMWFGSKRTSPQERDDSFLQLMTYLSGCTNDVLNTTAVTEIRIGHALPVDEHVRGCLQEFSPYTWWDMEDYLSFPTASGEISLYSCYTSFPLMPKECRDDALNAAPEDEWSFMSDPVEYHPLDNYIGVDFAISNMQTEFSRDINASDLKNAAFWKDFSGNMINNFLLFPGNTTHHGNYSEYLNNIKAQIIAGIKEKNTDYLNYFN